LLTSEDAKLERLKLAILFTIADIFWVKKNKANACHQKIQKIRNMTIGIETKEIKVVETY